LNARFLLSPPTVFGWHFAFTFCEVVAQIKIHRFSATMIPGDCDRMKQSLAPNITFSTSMWKAVIGIEKR
jgi:hypothetical protein